MSDRLPTKVKDLPSEPVMVDLFDTTTLIPWKRAETWFDDHEHTTQCAGVVIPKAYDGVLFWSCSDGELRNRWSSMYHIHKIAEKEMERWRAKSTH